MKKSENNDRLICRFVRIRRSIYTPVPPTRWNDYLDQRPQRLDHYEFERGLQVNDRILVFIPEQGYEWRDAYAKHVKLEYIYKQGRIPKWAKKYDRMVNLYYNRWATWIQQHAKEISAYLKKQKEKK